jgi:hypothetical protein
VKRATLFLIALGISACGGSYQPHTASTGEPQSDLEGYEARLAALRLELDDVAPARQPGEPLADAPPTSESCDTAADLRDRICDLSQRICDIAARDPGSADVALKCQHADDACQDAHRRVSDACGGRWAR